MNTNLNNMYEPTVWGPKFWSILHLGTMLYPENPSQTYKERMKWFIWGIPVIIPCDICRDHATAYITKRENEINTVVSSKQELFKFFVDFHNAVNKRYGKPVLSYEEAYALYNQSG